MAAAGSGFEVPRAARRVPVGVCVGQRRAGWREPRSRGSLKLALQIGWCPWLGFSFFFCVLRSPGGAVLQKLEEASFLRAGSRFLQVFLLVGARSDQGSVDLSFVLGDRGTRERARSVGK